MLNQRELKGQSRQGCLSEFSKAGVARLTGNPNAVLGTFWKACHLFLPLLMGALYHCDYST